jgi:hypothetical protein
VNDELKRIWKEVVNTWRDACKLLEEKLNLVFIDYSRKSRSLITYFV